MRLTKRLLQLASWLMIRRDHKEGRITPQVMRRKLIGVSLTEPGRISHVKGFGTLPEGLRTLVVASFALHDRIVRLDQAMQVKVDYPDGLEAAVDVVLASPVQAQVSRIERAFSRRRLRAVSSSS